MAAIIKIHFTMYLNFIATFFTCKVPIFNGIGMIFHINIIG